MRHTLFSLPVFLLSAFACVLPLAAQELPPATPPVAPDAAQRTEPMPTLPPMNPTQLMRMRADLTFQLQESQRVLALVGQNDKQLVELHQTQQQEIIEQLKNIETQLKTHGMSGPMPPGGTNSAPALPPQAIPGVNRMPPMNPQPMPRGIIPEQNFPTAVPPNGFDQAQAWANSPWVPQPSKELAEMKQTVEALRQEIAELNATVKALETQIQLLNRNILQSLPPEN